MATRKLNMLEKIANNLGVIYRYNASQFPRRWDLLKKVAQRELAPPTPKDWPAIKADWAKLGSKIENGAYRDLSVREALVYMGVCIEVICWFFVGEVIGRRNLCGYVVPGTYVSKSAKKQAKKLESEYDDKTQLK